MNDIGILKFCNCVISVPVLAISIAKRFRFENRKMTKYAPSFPQFVPSCAPVVLYSKYRFIVTQLVPNKHRCIYSTFIQCIFKRFAATAAPPVRSLVFTINTLILLFSYYKDKSFKRNNRKMLQRMI